MRGRYRALRRMTPARRVALEVARVKEQLLREEFDAARPRGDGARRSTSSCGARSPRDHGWSSFEDPGTPPDGAPRQAPPRRHFPGMIDPEL